MSWRETRVFLGNLPPGVRVRDVEEFFRKVGRVKNVLIKQGKYGFAEFDDGRAAEDAVYDMHGRRMNGSKITVELAKGTQQVKEKRRAPWVSKYGAPQRTKFRLKVLNLSSRISWQDLKDKLRKAGEVTYAEAHTDRRNEGRVELATMEDLERVVKRYQGYDMNGRKIELVKDIIEEKAKSKSKERKDSNSRSGSKKSRSASKRSRSRSKDSYSESKASRPRLKDSYFSSKRSRSGSKPMRSESRGSRSRSKESYLKNERSRSKSSKSCSSGKSESISPSKKVDIDDKDIKRLRKRSHSRSTESKRSATSRSSKRSKHDRSHSNSSEKDIRRSQSGYERSTSRASRENDMEEDGLNDSNSS